MDLVAQVEEVNVLRKFWAPLLVYAAYDVFGMKALARLYHNHDAEERRAAQKWLLTLQHSPEAWQMAWLLLQNTKVRDVQKFSLDSACNCVANAVTSVFV